MLPRQDFALTRTCYASMEAHYPHAGHKQLANLIAVGLEIPAAVVRTLGITTRPNRLYYALPEKRGVITIIDNGAAVPIGRQRYAAVSYDPVDPAVLRDLLPRA